MDDFNERYGTEALWFCFDAGHADLVGIDFEKPDTIHFYEDKRKYSIYKLGWLDSGIESN